MEDYERYLNCVGMDSMVGVSKEPELDILEISDRLEQGFKNPEAVNITPEHLDDALDHLKRPYSRAERYMPKHQSIGVILDINGLLPVIGNGIIYGEIGYD